MYVQCHTPCTPQRERHLYQGSLPIVDLCQTQPKSCNRSDLQYHDPFHIDGTRCLGKGRVSKLFSRDRERGIRLTGNQDVAIMCDKVFNDLLRTVHDINVSPVNPGMLGLQGSRKQIVSGLAHRLSSRSLCGEAVSGLDIHVHGLAEIFLHNQNTVEGNLVCPLLYSVKFRRENGQGIIRGVADQETKVDEIMGVGKLGEKIEVFD